MRSATTVLSGDRINLERIKFLIVDDNLHSLNIMDAAISAFGGHKIVKCRSAKAAREVIGVENFDFIVTDAQMPEETGYDLLRWLRREASMPNKFAPALICTGHTRQSQVLLARDCGAHFLVAKPIAPKVLLERIFWVARDERRFVECGDYHGPDRRFQQLGPPAGVQGRRKEDLAEKIAEDPDLSAEEVDALMNPTKVVL